MSGRTSLLLWLLLSTCAGALPAQSLPGIEQFEVENVRLTILDDKGVRRGMLTGDMARRARDGRVSISGAELKIERKLDAFVLTAEEFTYTPDTGKFETAAGVSISLPGGGLLLLPAGKGDLDFTDGVKLNMTTEGTGTLRSGADARTLANATVVNPTVAAVLVDAEDDNSLTVESVSISGTRGGELALRLARLPGVSTEPAARQAVVNLSCFGDVSLTIRDNGASADLNMLRRARLDFKDEDRSLEVTSNRLAMRGRVVRSAEGSSQLVDLALDAQQNVRLVGDGFTGTGGELRYREFLDRREARLSSDAMLTRDQGVNEQLAAVQIELRAKGYVDLVIPFAEPGGNPPEIAVELNDAARVKQSAGARIQWQITGQLVRLYSHVGAAGVYNHSFDGFSEGYTPLLRVFGPLGSAVEGEGVELQRAAVSGSRAEGSFIDGMATVRVYGPEAMGVVYSNAPLASLMRVALGLQAPPAEGELPPLQNSRLVVRADSWLDLSLHDPDLGIEAVGNVRLDHEPLPRDDANLVTLTGDQVALQLDDRRLQHASMRRLNGSPALATLGYDLLECRSIVIDQWHDHLRTSVVGPGRMVARDASSVDYFRSALDRLPKRTGERAEPPKPDAAWLDFGDAFSARIAKLERSLEVERPQFYLVMGEFERPRAGRSAVNDLTELRDPEVMTLYEASGARAYAASVTAVLGGTAVNLLRLEGDARVNSRFDGIKAFASEAIELSGSDAQQADDAPLTVVLLRDARLTIEDAGVFFGQHVRGGVFGYDGRWTLTSAERLEVTLRPVEQPHGQGSLVAARQMLARALQPKHLMIERLHQLERTVVELEGLTTGERPASFDQVWQALDETRDARHAMSLALRRQMHGARDSLELRSAERSARRARSLLSALVDVAGQGGMLGAFRSEDPTVPPLDITMGLALITFDGLGQLVDVRGGGPIEVSRASYTLKGERLSRDADGTLRLDGAAILLPADTGVTVSGVRTIALKQREDKVFGDLGRRRTMVTRVEGRDLKVKVKLKMGGE